MFSRMRSFKGRPVIEGNDSPMLVEDALRASTGYWYSNQPEELADAWQKTAADARGALEDGFRIVDERMLQPNGEATLFVNPDDLELALIAYGSERIEARPHDIDTEIAAINGLLHSIDQLKAGTL